MKNKGFTLVELLAVIVILAVISLIATPMVLGVIEKSKKSAAIESVNGIVDAAEKYMIEGMITGDNITKFDLSTDTKLSYKGKKPESGTLLINDKGKMSIKAKINGYCVMKKYNESTPQVVDNSICEENYKETILNGTDPVLKDKLVPVIISDNGEVTYADTSMEWYNYENKIWANAVILVENPSKTYSVGDTILEDDIESYFVWIPKYSYKLWDLGNYDSRTSVDTSKVHSIDIVFGTDNTSDSNSNECTTPLTSGESGNCDLGDYMTHPAFITLGVNGIWIGKFETGYKGATTKEEAQVNSVDATKIIIKPNVYSWRSINVSNMYNTSLAYNTTLESHMMKNTEWGAVAYLSNSVYGINTEITINNCSSFVTGIGGDTVSASGTDATCGISANKWTGEKGKLASTTGNISGIYDMSGGAYEYMASYRSDGVKDSGFSTLPTGKYVDVYAVSYDSYSNYTGRILGDAIGEMGPFELSTNSICSWYDDRANFIDSNYPWFVRGGSYNNIISSGLLYFGSYSGKINNYNSFRLVLAPNS